MAVFKCKICGGTLEINVGETVATCEYCGTKQTLPKLDDEKKANLFERANHFRRNNDFDKAMSIYEQILNEDAEDAECYWSIVLCRYGIEYVEDPSTHKRVPTVNRAQFTSVFDDEDYKSAIKYADNYQKDLYEQEARTINEIQKGILAISGQEEPFDVFICYKESDNSGRRTPDSVLATELYHELTREGFKVFFSRITLEDKLGTAYEPYIFAALHSSKVMVVLGTRPEYFNAVWVKNEWSRYLALIKNGARKILIPAYRDMNPYDLPEEFSHLQAQDMTKLGFMQDLIRGINKICGNIEPAIKHQNTPVNKETNTSILLERALLHLEAKEWSKANHLLEEILKMDIHTSDVYIGKCMVGFRVTDKSELAKKGKALLKNNNFKLALRFANEVQKQNLQNIIDEIEKQIRTNKEKLNRKCKVACKVSVILAICLAAIIVGYKGYEIIEPQIKSSSRYLKSADVGDEIMFGKYEQDNINTENEYIEWIVLKKEPGKILALSKYVLDGRKYNDTGFSFSNFDRRWKDCYLREWLNNDFYEDAFSDEEKNNILLSTYKETRDYVFLLSDDDANSLLKELGTKVYPTPYAISNGVITFNNGSFDGECLWWLKDGARAYSVGTLNIVDEVISRDLGVRPAIWIDTSETK